MRPLVVLSLFDGMSCGQIALRELGVPVAAYYASEIDARAVRTVQRNFPATVQMGDVRGVRAADLPPVDLVMGGSPCQGFSAMGLRKGLADARSALFWEFVRIVGECKGRNPGCRYLLENVEMHGADLETINGALGMLPVKIDSARVSAQHRERLYWSDIRAARHELFGRMRTDIPQPADRGVRLADILQGGDAVAGAPPATRPQRARLLARLARMRRLPDGTYFATPVANRDGLLSVRQDKAGTLTANCKEHYVMRIAGGGGRVAALRRFSVAEMMRLQTVPDWYDMGGVSWHAAAHMLGNGWTVEVIRHILAFLA